MADLKNAFKLIVFNYIETYPDFCLKDLVDKIIAEQAAAIKAAGYSIGYDAINSKVRYFKKHPELKDKMMKDEVVMIAKDETKWAVHDGKYHWIAKNGEIILGVDFIDQLFFEYSEYGLNLSQTEIINKHDIEVWQWFTIKSTLQLYKKSHVFSPYTVKNTPASELEAMVAEKVGKVFTSIGYQVEKTYDKQLRSEYKSVIKKQTQKDLVHQTVITELQDFVTQLPELKILPAYRINPHSSDKIISVFIFDIHFGAEQRTADLPEYSPEITKQMFKEIARQVNATNAKEVHIFFGGDNIETFTGLNHPDSWKGIAKGYFGAEVVKRAYKAIVEFVSEVNNVKSIYAVPGNHDRATQKADVDGQGYIADILFELIKLSFKGVINVKYSERVISESIDNLHFIMSHGHLKLTNMQPAELILEYGDPYKFNILVSGHWHNRKILKDHKNFRQIVCPSLFPGNDYSVNLGVSSAPGFLMIENWGNGKPKILDYSL